MHPRTEPDAEDDTKAVRHDATPLSSSDDEPTESTPLVSARRPGTGRSRTDSILRAAQNIHVPKVHNPDLIVGIFCGIILVGAGAGGLWTIPATRMVEDIVCRSYYDVLISDDIDESQCKEDAIQSKVATIFAIYGALQASIGAAAAFPWGIVADRYGRKRVFSLTVIGMVLSFLWFAVVCAFPQTLPIKAVWFGTSLQVLGGGNAVLSAIVFSMLADVTTSENRLVVSLPSSSSALANSLPKSQGLHARASGVHDWEFVRPSHLRMDDGEDGPVARCLAGFRPVLDPHLHHSSGPRDEAG